MKVKVYDYYHHMNKVTTGTVPEIAEETGLTKQKLWRMRKSPKRIQPNQYNQVEHYLVPVDEVERNQIYALYRGEQLIADGTVKEIARAVQKPEDTVRWYATPAARKRNLKMTLVKLEEDEG